MKFGFRIPSLKKRIAARTSVPRFVRQNLGFKAPRGMGWLTDPKKAMYNKVYQKTTRGCLLQLMILTAIIGFLVGFSSCDMRSTDDSNYEYVSPSLTRTGKVRKAYVRRKVSYSPSAYKSRARSRYYYHTRGKYRR
ncbi:MAG: hypothetical protein ACKOXP_10620 [Flavobacteriales bacterium]